MKGRRVMASSIQISGQHEPDYDEILTPEALAFIEQLHRHFEPRRQEILQARAVRQAEINDGGALGFLDETAGVREADWQVAPAPADLNNRRVEITGPAERKMIINALNCGANVFMADFEDALSPTWDNLVRGQLNLRDAVRRTISFENPDGRQYSLNDDIATLVIRPRGWHLWERHLLVDGQPLAGGIVDFGLYFFHNAQELLVRGSGPYFYLPKTQSHREARLWNDIFNEAQ